MFPSLFKKSPTKHHRRTGSMFQSEDGAELDELVRASSYLSGTGESKAFNADAVIEECDEVLRTMFFGVVQETEGEGFFEKARGGV